VGAGEEEAPFMVEARGGGSPPRGGMGGEQSIAGGGRK